MAELFDFGCRNRIGMEAPVHASAHKISNAPAPGRVVGLDVRENRIALLVAIHNECRFTAHPSHDVIVLNGRLYLRKVAALEQLVDDGL